MKNAYGYSPEQQEIIKARALKILEGHVTEDMQIGNSNGVFKNATKVVFIRDNIWYTFIFWMELSPEFDIILTGELYGESLTDNYYFSGNRLCCKDFLFI